MASSKFDHSDMQETLTCSVCHELLQDPQTLTQCLHNYCKSCVQQLQRTQTNPGHSNGISCPLCRKVTPPSEIRDNHFVKEMVAYYKSAKSESQKTVVTCEKCDQTDSKQDANCRCVDCKCYMCQPCKLMHSKFTNGHRVFELNDDTKLTIDKLLFCDVHTEEPLKFHCDQCQKIICIMCHAVSHKNHDVVTIEDALKVMLPQANGYIEKLSSKHKEAGGAMTRLQKEEEDMKKEFESRRNYVDRKADERVQEILKDKSEKKEALVKTEEEQKKKFNECKKQLTEYQSKINHLQNIALASIEKAQHVSLLNELVQGGLHGKLKNMSEEDIPSAKIESTSAGTSGKEGSSKRKTSESGAQNMSDMISQTKKQFAEDNEKRRRRMHEMSPARFYTPK